MTVLLGRQIVETVGKVQCLRISESLAQFLDTAVYITEIEVDLLDGLAVNRCAETQHAVSGRVLRTYVKHELLGREDSHLTLFHRAVSRLHISHGSVLYLLMVKTYRIDRRIVVVVFSKRVSHPVVAQKQAPHVGVVYKYYAVVVVDFAFIQIGYSPKVGYAVKHGVFTVVGSHLDRDMRVMGGRCEVVHTTESVGPVHTH